jgi:hypothetical protein
MTGRAAVPYAAGGRVHRPPDRGNAGAFTFVSEARAGTATMGG